MDVHDTLTASFCPPTRNIQLYICATEVPLFQNEDFRFRSTVSWLRPFVHWYSVVNEFSSFLNPFHSFCSFNHFSLFFFGFSFIKFSIYFYKLLFCLNIFNIFDRKTVHVFNFMYYTN